MFWHIRAYYLHLASRFGAEGRSGLEWANEIMADVYRVAS